MSLLLIRHGPTSWNAERRLQGRSDIPLSEAGSTAVAAWRLPDAWRGLPAWTSPLVRAVATGALLGLAPSIEERLIEVDWGEWEGRKVAEVRAEDPAGFARREARGLDFRAPNGESYREAAMRIAPLLDRDGILLTHRGMMMAALAVRTGWPMVGPPPVAITHQSDALLLDGDRIAAVPLAP